MKDDNDLEPSNLMELSDLSVSSTGLASMEDLSKDKMASRPRPSFHIDSSSDEEEDAPLTMNRPSNGGSKPVKPVVSKPVEQKSAPSYLRQNNAPASQQKKVYSASYQRRKLQIQKQQEKQEQQQQQQRQRLLRAPVSQYQRTDPRLPYVSINSDLVYRFGSESLQSFSFAFISQNSISSRLDILKRSLEFLRDNPALANMNNSPSTSSTTALEGFFTNASSSLNTRHGKIRSSASSAALSMLSNYPSIASGPSSRFPASGNPLSRRPTERGGLLSPNLISSSSDQTTRTPSSSSFLASFAGEPAHTKFDNNLKSVLNLLENAHVFPVSGSSAASSMSDVSSLSSSEAVTSSSTLVSENSFTSSTLSDALSSSRQNLGNLSSSRNLKNTLLEPVAFRKQTKNSAATFHLQSQLLDALATPYYDPSWTTLIQRTGAVTSMPTVNISASTVDLKSLERNAPVFSSAAAILHPVSSKYTANQAVFTTSANEPFLILASNDISCLVFGMSKAEIRRKNIIDLIQQDYKEYVLTKARNSPLNSTFLCGTLIPIIKLNGQTGTASFFAKKHNSGIIAWVIEEVASDSAYIDVDMNTYKFTLSGPQHEVLFPFINSSCSDLTIHDILSGIPKDLHLLADGLRKSEFHTENHVTISGTTIVPCNIQEYVSDDKPKQDNILSLQLTSLPHIAGIILLDPSNMTITGYNASVVEQIFGYSSCQENECVGWSIDELIPNFTNYISKIEKTCSLDLKGTANQGLVVPEHLFRKVAVQSRMKSRSCSSNDSAVRLSNNMNNADLATNNHKNPDTIHGITSEHAKRFALSGDSFMPSQQRDTITAFMSSKGIEGQHKDGILITIDVQMRIIGDGNAALWVTYSRNITGQNESSVLPSQLSLLSMKKATRSRFKKTSSTRSHESDFSATSIDSEKSESNNGGHSNASTHSGDSNVSLSSMSDKASSQSLSKLNINTSSLSHSRQNSSEAAPNTTVSSSLEDNNDQQSNTNDTPSTENKPDDAEANKAEADGSLVDGPLSPKTATCEENESNALLSTPKSQIKPHSLDDAPNSVSSPYSIHIPELGARRREKKLEDFKILKKMGEGAYGKVILAEYSHEPSSRVVVKSVVKERILVDTWTRDRKLGTIPNEIKVMAALGSWPHENVMKLLDFFEDDEFFHIEMEPHGNPGCDLFDLIEMKQQMVEPMIKELFKQVLAAVLHLHNHDIVHRDIKDENVIADLSELSECAENEDGSFGKNTGNGGIGTGAVKLIDFGSSAFVRQGPFDVFVGTLDYAAPEVLAGHPYEGRPQDVWALGILLYTLIYKENPFYNVDEIMDHDLRIPFIMSKESIHLITKILTRNVRKRPKCQDIWDHPWIQNKPLTPEMEKELEEILEARMAQNGK